MASQFFSFLALSLSKGLFFVFSLASTAQETVNLVPNPSFEEFENGCPESFNEMPLEWSRWRSSPDRFSTCIQPQNLLDSLGWAPWNSFSYQWPADGESYVGMFAFGPNPFNNNSYREYLGCELIEPLELGETYNVSFKTNLAIGGAYPAPGYYTNPVWACSHMGLLFTTQPYHFDDNPMPIPNFAHIYSETLITDTLNWITISGEVVADQAYTHMALGVFFEMAYLDTLRLQYIPGLNGLGAYFYADDVCVSKHPDCAVVLETGEHSINSSGIKLYPNPATEHLYFSSDINISMIEVFDLNGRVVYVSSIINTTSGEVSISHLSPGIYTVLAKTEKTILREKLVIVH